MTRAAIYVRVSTTAQEQGGSSLGTQEAACNAFAEQHGYAVQTTIVEVHTGTELWERKELARLRDMIRARQFDVLVAYAIDRLARDPVHLGVIISEASHYGTEVEFVTEPLDASPEGELIRFVRGFAAKVEHEKIRERAIRGRRARALSGKLLPGPRPLFGYRYRAGGRDALDIDPETSVIVQRIFRDVLAGHSLHQIADELADDGILSPTGKPRWAIGVISRLLRHPAYAGRGLLLTERKGNHYYIAGAHTLELPAGVIPPLVTPAEQDAVCEQLDRNRARASRYSRYPEAALVRGIIRCAHCGHKLIVRRDFTKPPPQPLVYTCESERKHLAVCRTHKMRADHVDAVVWSRVHDYLNKAAAAEWQPDAGADTNAAEVAAIARAITDVARRQGNLTRELGIATGDAYLPDLIRAQLAELGSRRAQLEEERAKLLRHDSDREANRTRLLDLAVWAREWSSELDSLPYAERRLLLDAFGVEVTLKRRKGPGPRVTVTLTRVPTAAGASILARTARSGCQEVWVRL